MLTQRNQQTIARVCHVSGHGYWSGQPVTVTIRPAPIDHGIVFRRTDLHGQPSLAAVSSNRMEMSLRTRLVSGPAAVEMVEHVMAALYGMQIDNCIVECNAAEMPGLDGSALAIALAIESVGIVVQSQVMPQLEIVAPYRIGDDRQWIMLLPSIEPGLVAEYRLDFGTDSVIPPSIYRTPVTADVFLSEIAPARTFITKADADWLQSRGLAKHVTYRDLLVFDESGPIDNCLRYGDECARHKLLDLIGDLALSGVGLQGRVIASRSGHVLNGRMADWIRSQRDGGENGQQTLRRVAA